MTRASRKRRQDTPTPPVLPTEHLMTGGDRRQMRRAAWESVFRVTAVVAVLALLYAFAPLGQRLGASVLFELCGALFALTFVTVWEFRNVARSSYPEFRALEAAAVTLALFLVSYAAIYYVMSEQVADSFNEHLTRLDSLYFTMTTFSTVGYGDIVAHTEVARAVVTSQIVIDLLLIALIGKALFSTARRRREGLSTNPDETTGPGGG